MHRNRSENMIESLPLHPVRGITKLFHVSIVGFETGDDLPEIAYVSCVREDFNNVVRVGVLVDGAGIHVISEDTVWTKLFDTKVESMLLASKLSVPISVSQLTRLGFRESEKY